MKVNIKRSKNGEHMKSIHLISYLILFISTIVFIGCQEENIPTKTDQDLTKKANNEISTDDPTSGYSWQNKYYNGGNGRIGGWILSSNDKFIPCYTPYGPSLTYDYHHLLVINPSGSRAFIDPELNVIEYGQSSKIGNWVINSNDKYTSIVGNISQTYIFAVNPSNHAWHLLRFDNAFHQWVTSWSGSGSFGGWNIGNEDFYTRGRFNPSDPNNQQILAINYNSHWAALKSYPSYANWTSVWSNSGSGVIAAWNIQAGDKYIVSDFDGDGYDELMCIKDPWAVILDFSGSSWNTLWSNNGSGYIAGWNIDSNDKTGAGNLDNSNTPEEILITNSSSQWAAVFRYSSGSVVQLWGNAANGYVGYHQLNLNDIHFVLRDFNLQYSTLTTINLTNARTQQFINTTPVQDDVND
jgi:hypothetical protein